MRQPNKNNDLFKLFRSTDLPLPIRVLPLDAAAELIDRCFGTVVYLDTQKGRPYRVTNDFGGFLRDEVFQYPELTEDELESQTKLIKGKQDRKLKQQQLRNENDKAKKANRGFIFGVAMSAIALPLVRGTLSIGNPANYLPFSISRSANNRLTVVLKQTRSVYGVTKAVFDGMITVVMRVIEIDKVNKVELVVEDVIAPIRKGRPTPSIHAGIDEATAVRQAVEKTKTAIIESAEHALAEANDDVLEASSLAFSEGAPPSAMEELLHAEARRQKAEVFLAKARKLRSSQVKVLVQGDGYSSHQDGGKRTEKLGNLYVVVTEVKLAKQTLQMEVFIESQNGNVVRTDLAQHFGDAKVITTIDTPDPRKTLAEQEVEDSVPGLEQGAKGFESKYMKVTYAAKDGGPFQALAPNKDGNFMNRFDDVKSRGSYPGHGMFSQDDMLTRLTGGSFEGTFTTVKSWDTGTEDNAYFTDSGLAWSLWLSPNPIETTGVKKLTIVLGVGTGGKRLRRDGLVNGIDVAWHENDGHRWIWLRAPMHQFPSDCHEALADCGALLRKYMRLFQRGLLTSKYVFEDKRLIGHYTAGNYRDADGNEAIRDARTVHGQHESGEPHARGRALAGSVMDSFEADLRNRIANGNDNQETIGKWLEDCIKCFDNLITTSKGRKTTFEDVLGSHLAYDKKNNNASNQDGIKASYKKRDIVVATLETVEDAVNLVAGEFTSRVLILSTADQALALAAARRAQMRKEQKSA